MYDGTSIYKKAHRLYTIAAKIQNFPVTSHRPGYMMLVDVYLVTTKKSVY